MNWFRFLVKAGIHGAIDLAGIPARSRDRMRGQLVVLTYHRFGEYWPTGLLGALPAARFQRQLRFLTSAFQVVSLADGLQNLGAQRRADKPWLAITFDDGFGDNFSHAFPLLVEHRIPATVFLATDFLDRRRLPWPTAIAAVLDGTRRKKMKFPFSADIAHVRAKGQALRHMMDTLGPTPPEARFAVIDEFARHMQVEMPSQPGPLTWHQVREMQRAGIEFGSHTVFHSRLHESERWVVQEELATSKARIEQELDTRCRFFAYPDGAWDIGSSGAVKEAGYDAGITQDFGANAKECDPYAIKRIEVPYDDPIATFRCRNSLAL